MRKLLTVLLAALLCVGLAVSAFAIAVKSPSQGGVPDIEMVSSDFLDENGNPVGAGCEAELRITPYQEKDVTDSEIIKKSLETAYDSYKNDFGTDARAMLKAADPAGNWGNKYPGYELKVVNIFDITVLCKKNVHNDGYGVLYEYHGDHHVSMELSDADASNFVALMHYRDVNHDYDSTGDAKWELVETTQNGNEISFSVQCSNLSPFAIIVKTRDGGSGIGGGIIGGINGGNGNGNGSGQQRTSPQTGELDNSGYWVSCGIFFAVVGVTALYRGKKEKRYAR